MSIQQFIQLMPEISNYDDLGIKSFMVFVILCLSGVVWHLYNRVNDLSDKITQLQDAYRGETIGTYEKTLSTLPAFEKSILENQSEMKDSLKEFIRDQNKEMISDLKEIIKK